LISIFPFAIRVSTTEISAYFLKGISIVG